VNRKLLFGFFFLIITIQARGELSYTPTINKAFENILRLRLDEGRRLLSDESKENSDNTLSLLYFNYIDFLKAFIKEEKPYADSLRLNAERRLRNLEHESTSSPWLRFAQAEILLQNAFIKIKFREYVSGALDVRKAFKLAEENTRLFPQFVLNKKLMGLLHAIMGNVPQEYHWLVNLAGMEGTTVQGMNEMNEALKLLSGTEYKIYREEILFYMAMFQSSLSTNGIQENTIMNSLEQYIDESLLLTYCYVNLAMKAGRNDEALTALNRPSIYRGTFPFAYLNYKRGLLKLRKLDYSSAIDFEQFLKHFRGINFIKAAYQKLGWIALLNGDQRKYKTYMDSCVILGKAIVDEDKDALNEAKDSLSPDLTLLRTRLFFDGGYYTLALKEISGLKLSTSMPLRIHLEYMYRYARLFHKIAMMDKAIQYYEYTLSKGKSKKWYYAANSALLLATIYEDRKEYAKAKEYYEKCLSMRHHDYQNSIDQRAQVGLERVKKKI
jgi:hypothetical protein